MAELKDRRARSEKKRAPRVKVLQGAPVPSAVIGLVPTWSARPRPVGTIEIADEMVLAQHLVRDLTNFIHFGDRALLVRETVGPILEHYAVLQQQSRDKDLSSYFAGLAWDAVEAKRDPATVLAITKSLRRELTWHVNDRPVDVDMVESAAAAKRRRGPAASQLKRAARVYRVLAWNSRASVQPARLDNRDDRNSSLLALLKRQRQVRDYGAAIVRDFAAEREAAKTRRKPPRP